MPAPASATSVGAGGNRLREPSPPQAAAWDKGKRRLVAAVAEAVAPSGQEEVEMRAACGDSTRRTLRVWRWAPCRSWSCLCSSSPPSSCCTFGANTRAPEKWRLRTFFFCPLLFLSHALTRNCNGNSSWSVDDCQCGSSPDTPILFYKNTFYKNIQAENPEKIRTSIRTCPASILDEKNFFFIFRSKFVRANTKNPIPFISNLLYIVTKARDWCI